MEERELEQMGRLALTTEERETVPEGRPVLTAAELEEKEGLVLTEDENQPEQQQEPLALTTEQMEHLVLLGSIAGSPAIIVDAMRSGNIFDPAHMERAQQMKTQWDDGASLLAPYFERQKRIDAEREQLRQMGLQMEGTPRRSSYAHIEAQLGDDLGLPSEDWILRIQTDSPCNYVDIKLAPYADYIADCLIYACRGVPRFEAVLHRPGKEAMVVFTHSCA